MHLEYTCAHGVYQRGTRRKWYFFNQNRIPLGVFNAKFSKNWTNLKLLNFVHTDDKILKICFLYFQSIRRNGYYYTRSNCTPRIPRRTLVVLHTCKKPHFCTNYPGSTLTSNSKNVIFYCLFHRWIGVAVVQAFDTLSRVLPTVQYGFQILGLCHQQQPVSDSHFAQ